MSYFFSCLFHDCCKNGIENKKHTEHSHPIIAHDFINKCYYDFSETHPYNKINITMIINTIAKHMGKWTNSKYSNIILPAPEYEEDFLYMNVIILRVENIVCLMRNILINFKHINRPLIERYFFII